MTTISPILFKPSRLANRPLRSTAEFPGDVTSEEEKKSGQNQQYKESPGNPDNYQEPTIHRDRGC